MPNVCPECNKDDAIQKLTSITAAGEASGTFSGPSVGLTRVDGKWATTGGYSTSSGSIKTNLARRLAPPEEPRPPSLQTLVYTIGYLGMLVWACLLGGFALAAFAEPTAEDNPVGLGFLLLALAMLSILGIWALSKEQAAKRREVDRQRPAWRSAMARYQRAYYCFRDDIVFDPETAETCSPDNLGSFLSSDRSRPLAS